MVFDLHQKTLNKMENISEQYSNADIEGKRLLLGSIFPNKIHFENKKVRTADVNLIFIEINSIKITYKGIKKRTSHFYRLVQKSDLRRIRTFDLLLRRQLLYPAEL